MKLIIASHNEGKIKEFKEVLEPLGYKVFKSNDFDIDISEVIEDGDDFKDNAIIKAKFLYDKLEIPVISDDSGLVLKSFPNLLGVHSARFMENESYSIKNKAVLEKYNQSQDRSAYFKTALVYYNGQAHIFEGIVEGVIANNVLGDNGFGYDPIFIPKGYDHSFAEMTRLEKSKISHRGRAIRKLVRSLKEGLR